MHFDTIYRHNQALSPDALSTIPAALHAVVAGIEDCRRAGRSADHDPAVMLLLRHLARLSVAQPLDEELLRTCCRTDRARLIAHPALEILAGHALGGDPAAKRTFHHQVRQALRRAAEAMGLDEPDVRIRTALGADHDDGSTELAHASIAIRVVPRGFLPRTEVSVSRCEAGQPVGRLQHRPARVLLDAPAFAAEFAPFLAHREPARQAA